VSDALWGDEVVLWGDKVPLRADTVPMGDRSRKRRRDTRLGDDDGFDTGCLPPGLVAFFGDNDEHADAATRANKVYFMVAERQADGMVSVDEVHVKPREEEAQAAVNTVSPDAALI
jgi:hypothetical protein